ncbi:metal ABC transporter ATP-binding protein [Stackebrandtia soli]|uniref:metal ABC transporter ATP-binding protein n=1 Tax=Stackebrandtia soli TaxID=1892856 RepID=UPI0039E9FBA3
MTVIDVRGATVRYDKRDVLHGVGLTVAEGEAVALLGANGSGKSTLVKALLGLVPLSSGQALLFGRPTRSFRNRSWIGYVPQRLGIGGGVPATVSEVVSAGRLARRRIPFPATAEDRRIVADSLASVGLADRAAEPVAALSGGQQQRVLIARALATRPKLLVMDEPTSGVDAANQELFAKLLAERLAEGCAVLIVMHELGPLADIIDRAVVLSDGHVTHDGPLPTPRGADGDHPHGVLPDDNPWSGA